MTSEHEKLDPEALVSVRDVPDEAAATLLVDFLKGQGIEATAVPVQIAWFSTIQTALHGYWGHVEVLQKDAARAGELIEEYLKATPQPESTEE